MLGRTVTNLAVDDNDVGAAHRVGSDEVGDADLLPVGDLLDARAHGGDVLHLQQGANRAGVGVEGGI